MKMKIGVVSIVCEVDGSHLMQFAKRTHQRNATAKTVWRSKERKYQRADV